MKSKDYVRIFITNFHFQPVLLDLKWMECMNQPNEGNSPSHNGVFRGGFLSQIHARI